MSEISGVQPRNDRRKKARVKLTRGLIAHFDTAGGVLIDASESGARIEHFTRHQVGKKAPFRFEWDRKPIEAEAKVVWSRVHRLTHADQGTVFQSGLCFENSISEMQTMVTTLIARSLAEQMANARGLGPAAQRSMNVPDRGFIRCTLVGEHRWDKKWSRMADQPEAGFTVPATETDENIDQLCETYVKSDADGRNLIQLMAQLSVERAEELRAASASATRPGRE
jgi:hypothetical protein